jgi:MoxR-like ATPase
VTPDDVKSVALPVLRHRILPSPEMEIEGRDVDQLLLELFESVEAPRA